MKKFAWFFPVSAGILWGSVGIFIRSLSGYGMDTATIVGSRTMISVILMLIGIAVIDKSQLKIRLKDLWIFVLASWLGMLGVNLTYNEAVNYVHLSLAAVLLSLSPVYVLILARLFFKEKITIRKAGCAALAIFGCSLASGLLESLGGMKLSSYGIFLGVASGVFYAMYSMFTKIAMKRGYSGLTITFYLERILQKLLHMVLYLWYFMQSVVQSFRIHFIRLVFSIWMRGKSPFLQPVSRWQQWYSVFSVSGKYRLQSNLSDCS